MQDLTPCPSCQRHVLVSESSCPFCSAPLSSHMAGLTPRTAPRGALSRAALFAFGTSAALATASCSDDGGDGSSAPHDASTDARVVDGGADTHPDASDGLRDATVGDASDAKAQVPVSPDAGDDDLGGIVPLYALAAPPPAKDAGASDAGKKDSGLDHGGVQPLYAAPPKPLA